MPSVILMKRGWVVARGFRAIETKDILFGIDVQAILL